MSETRIPETYGDIDGGFTDLASFRAELGPDVAHLSDDEAMRIVDENLGEKLKLTRGQRAQLDDAKDPALYDDRVYRDMANNMREKANREEAERRRLASELAHEKERQSAEKVRMSDEMKPLIASQARLRNELELEKMKRLYGDRFVWKSPGSMDDYLTKERLKREVKEELLEEKRKAKQQKDLAKLWEPERQPRRTTKARSPARKVSVARSKSKPKPKSKSPSAKKKTGNSSRKTARPKK